MHGERTHGNDSTAYLAPIKDRQSWQFPDDGWSIQLFAGKGVVGQPHFTQIWQAIQLINLLWVADPVVAKVEYLQGLKGVEIRQRPQPIFLNSQFPQRCGPVESGGLDILDSVFIKHQFPQCTTRLKP